MINRSTSGDGNREVTEANTKGIVALSAMQENPENHGTNDDENKISPAKVRE